MWIKSEWQVLLENVLKYHVSRDLIEMEKKAIKNYGKRTFHREQKIKRP